MKYSGASGPDDARGLLVFTSWEGCVLGAFVLSEGLRGPLLMAV